jgi:hypothetical protein
MERKLYGKEDVRFLETVFLKLALNFTWYDPISHTITHSKCMLTILLLF